MATGKMVRMSKHGIGGTLAKIGNQGGTMVACWQEWVNTTWCGLGRTDTHEHETDRAGH